MNPITTYKTLRFYILKLFKTSFIGSPFLIYRLIRGYGILYRYFLKTQAIT